MNYIANWTDKSAISMSGWSGGVTYNSSNGYLELTATNYILLTDLSGPGPS